MKFKKNNTFTPCQAIHEYCKTRCFTSQKAIRGCDDPECPLFPYRFGKNPNRKGIGGRVKTHKRGKKQQYAKIIPSQVTKIKPVEVNIEDKG